MKPRLYALIRAVEPVPGDRKMIGVMVLIACLVTALAVARVRARHQIVALGYQLSRATEEVRVERERRRGLELERATLINPARIRALATELGMIPVPADRIRVIEFQGGPSPALPPPGSRPPSGPPTETQDPRALAQVAP